jgi:hypothetical protein
VRFANLTVEDLQRNGARAFIAWRQSKPVGGPGESDLAGDFPPVCNEKHSFSHLRHAAKCGESVAAGVALLLQDLAYLFRDVLTAAIEDLRDVFD